MESIIINYISRIPTCKPEQLPLKNDTPLVESGILDSLALLDLLFFVEEQFNIPMDDFELLPENFNTVDALCAYIRSRN